MLPCRLGYFFFFRPTSSLSPFSPLPCPPSFPPFSSPAYLSSSPPPSSPSFRFIAYPNSPPPPTEGHLGLDNRFYLLDFSRTQPPELPNRNFKNAHLSRLLRPEFVRSYYKPLCPDAFSGFIKGTPGEQEHNADIEEATRHLYEVLAQSDPN